MSTEPCKHGHIDGAMHIPCYQCRCESLEKELALEQRIRLAVNENSEVLVKQLATKELAETKLREALDVALYAMTNSTANKNFAINVIEELLSTPITTDALDSYVAEKVREARGNWQPIKSAPKDGTVILVAVPSTDLCYTVEWRDEAENEEIKDGLGIGWRLTWDGYFFPHYDQPTHWMPLPAQPTEQPK